MTDKPLIPMSEWAHDHASLLMYLETRTVDHNGYIDNRNLRCDSRLHREFAHRRQDLIKEPRPSKNPFMALTANSGAYPTRLKTKEQEKHDDWSILEEFEAFGFVTNVQVERFYMTEVVGNSICHVTLSDKGTKAAAALRQHKASGQLLKDFDWSPYA
jgi:hypothetical protein